MCLITKTKYVAKVDESITRETLLSRSINYLKEREGFERTDKPVLF